MPGATDDVGAARLLSAAARAALDAIAAAADGLGWPAYVVGGLPRDALLGRHEAPDLDVVIAGDALAVADVVRTAAGGRVVRHARFLTATWRNGGAAIDLVTARRERYPAPGALPVVTPGTLDDDLARRDFTVNTLALPVVVGGFGALIDRFGARNDLAQGVVRVLHPASFRDDPTRLLRAVRTEARLGFRMDPDTEFLARDGVTGLAALSAARLRGELVRLFAEPRPDAALRRLEALGALAVLGPAPLVAGDAAALAARLAARRARLAPADAAQPLALAAWLAAQGPAGVAAATRLALSARLAADIACAVACAADPRLADGAAPASAVNAALAARHPTPVALVLAAVVADDGVRDRLDAYATRWAGRTPPIDGDDVVALGVPRGPAVGRVLAAVRAAWWDGAVQTRADALALARQQAKADAARRDEGFGAASPML